MTHDQTQSKHGVILSKVANWCKVTSVILLQVTGVIVLKVANWCNSLKVAGVILSKQCILLKVANWCKVTSVILLKVTGVGS